MATTQLRAGLKPRGEYSASVSYEKLDIVCVLANYTMYICKQACTGVPVTNTAYWTKCFDAASLMEDIQDVLDEGDIYTPQVGTVTTGNTSSVAIVNNEQTKRSVFNFVLEKGEKGDKGDKGDRGEKGDTSVLGEGTNYTLYNQKGSHTDGAMTQEATTKEINRLNTLVSELQRIVATIGDTVEGYVRVAGSSSPALSYKHYQKDGGDFGVPSVFNIFYPCLVGTPLTGSGTEGKILHILDKFGAQNDNGVAKWADLEGVLHNIDGSEGDVIVCNTIPYYRIMGKRTVNNVVYDVFLMSAQPFSWQGHESEKVEKCGMSPDYCVSHTDSDNVTRMHSVYNPSWNGSRYTTRGCVGKYIFSYNEQTGEMVETYDANASLMGDAGGLHTTSINLPTAEQRAMNNNPDTTKTVPCMNSTAAMIENMFALMLAEGGTFDMHSQNLMGSGFCSNDMANTDVDYQASGFNARNGIRVKDKNDTWRYGSFGSNFNFLAGGTGSIYAPYLINEWSNAFRIMEAQRAICYAIQHRIGELEWFAFEGNKYKWRSVDGFLNPTQGEMTCVLFKMFETKATSDAVDPTDMTTSIAGNRIQIIVSIALYHGVTTQVSPGWWTSGLLFTEDANGLYKCYMQRDQSKLSVTPVGDKLVTEGWDFEQTYNHVIDVAYKSNYVTDYNNDALMLPESDNTFGGSLHTYVCQYKWFNGGKAPEGKKGVRGFLRGGYANSGVFSPLSLRADYSPANAYSSFGFGICYQIVD